MLDVRKKRIIVPADRNRPLPELVVGGAQITFPSIFSGKYYLAWLNPIVI